MEPSVTPLINCWRKYSMRPCRLVPISRTGRTKASRRRGAATTQEGRAEGLTGLPKPMAARNLAQMTLCVPSQNGRSSVLLQPHRLKVPELSATKRCGCKVVVLWEPSQNGCLAERPQAHQK